MTDKKIRNQIYRDLGIPPEVLAALPSLDQIQAKTARAMADEGARVLAALPKDAWVVALGVPGVLATVAGILSEGRVSIATVEQTVVGDGDGRITAEGERHACCQHRGKAGDGACEEQWIPKVRQRPAQVPPPRRDEG